MVSVIKEECGTKHWCLHIETRIIISSRRIWGFHAGKCWTWDTTNDSKFAPGYSISLGWIYMHFDTGGEKVDAIT